ncbi:type VI secretion system Vgr family protein [Aquimarina algicola]|uniref:Gp5/Type VI secretion system Vgr protein OB-fold domain-containing protein n=1 Tax=Aquimarina algicola TaxID=2589995 RepID=A0A504J4K6_9FLAO|nr:phage baseplate assembly protein V [Aquimarina algicola]TPN85424.1 hypothetical protein FHK87_15530 [Aquimarina algicola]
MALQSKIQLFIGGVPILAFKSISLEQEIDQHHDLELVCRKDVLENITSTSDDESKDYLGQILVLKITSLNTFKAYKELKFKGVVTEVKSTNGFLYQHSDLIIIKAKSSSIITDDGPHFASYSDAGLATIIDNTFQLYDRSKLNTVINPGFSDTLHYSVQNGESSFQYASRLAKQYGEWFYYDGEDLVFGKPKDNEQVLLNYGQDLQEFSRNINPRSNSYAFFTNDYLNDQQHELATQAVNTGMNSYNGFASKKSEEIYPHKTNVFINTYNDPQIKQRLDTLVEQQKKSEEINQVIMSGKSDNPGVSLGKVVKIQNGPGDYTFRITKIKHETTENGKYSNTFEGVSIAQDASPKTNIRLHPKSDHQVAIVTDNADPEGLSRIKVQFYWQKPLGEFTPWLRVLTPHSGGEKGFHFIPEIGEEVLIGFEGGNAERPFVMGTLYNGNAKSAGWNTKNNDVKAIRTRSGHTIELNDADGKEFITIIDQNANTIHIDTANNNITITALEKMTLNAKNFEMNVEQDATFNIGQNTKMFTGMNFESSSLNHSNTVEDQMTTNVGTRFTQNSGDAQILSKTNMKIACGAVAVLQGGGNVKISKG